MPSHLQPDSPTPTTAPEMSESVVRLRDTRKRVGKGNTLQRKTEANYERERDRLRERDRAFVVALENSGRSGCVVLFTLRNTA